MQYAQAADVKKNFCFRDGGGGKNQRIMRSSNLSSLPAIKCNILMSLNIDASHAGFSERLYAQFNFFLLSPAGKKLNKALTIFRMYAS